jgi:hypothetical protein
MLGNMGCQTPLTTGIIMQKRRSCQGGYETERQEACRREAAIRSLIEAGPASHASADVVAKDLGIRRSLVLGFGEQWNTRMQLRLIIRGIGHRAATILTSCAATIFVLFAAATGTSLVSTWFGCLQPDCLPA